VKPSGGGGVNLSAAGGFQRYMKGGIMMLVAAVASWLTVASAEKTAPALEAAT